MKRAIFALAASACSTPTPQILLGFASSPSQKCPSTDCASVPLPCDAVMSIRLVEPGNPSHEYHAQCTKVPPNLGYDACSLFGVDLDAAPIPVSDVEVQIAVFPLSALSVDDHGDPVCPKDTQYSADGFPVEQSPAPALGAHAFYHPGDAVVKVTLGCTNISMEHAGPSCGSTTSGSISAMVDDFDTRLSVTGGAQGIASSLWVSVGEPHVLEGNYVLSPLDAAAMRLEGGDPPQWSATVPSKFNRYACVEVLEDAPQTTASLRCVSATAPTSALKGMRIAKDTLDGILKSLALSRVPEQGLTIGMVVDTLSRGVSDYVVTPTDGTTVKYLSASGVPGGSATSANGIFVSQGAPFGTRFSASGPNATVPAVGGLVEGKVTIVIVPFADRRSANPADPTGVVTGGP